MNKKRLSSHSESHSPVSIDLSPPIPTESSSVVLKRQITKEQTRHSSPPNHQQRPKSPPDRYQPRPSSNHLRHRSDGTLYLFVHRLVAMVCVFSTNQNQYRTLQ